MSRNLKTLGLALVAVLAMSAFAASSASATFIGKLTTTSGPYPKHLIGEDVGAEDEFVVGEDAIVCHEEFYTAQLTAATSTIEVTPEYGETCQTKGEPHWDVTVTENGCKLHFETGTNIKTDEDPVKVKVTCHGEKKQIEIHHYGTDGTPHDDPVCTNTVGNQPAVGTLTATSLTASGDILLEGTVHVTEQTHGLCSFGFTVNQTAEFKASTTIRDTLNTRIHIG